MWEWVCRATSYCLTFFSRGKPAPTFRRQATRQVFGRSNKKLSPGHLPRARMNQVGLAANLALFVDGEQDALGARREVGATDVMQAPGERVERLLAVLGERDLVALERERALQRGAAVRRQACHVGTEQLDAARLPGRALATSPRVLSASRQTPRTVARR